MIQYLVFALYSIEYKKLQKGIANHHILFSFTVYTASLWNQGGTAMVKTA